MLGSLSSVGKNALGLMGIRISGIVLPVVVVPFLTRTLGPSEWGRLALAQALSVWTMLIMEYGFALSAVRAVSRSRGSREQLSKIVQGVQGAKVLLSVVCALIGFVSFLTIPALRGSPELVTLGCVSGVVTGWSPVWFYQGIERMVGASVITALARAFATLGVFVLVGGPSDGWRVLALQAGFATVSTVVLSIGMYIQVEYKGPAWVTSLSVLKSGWETFMLRAVSSVYTVANTLVLGVLAPAAEVAFFAGPERMVRALLSFLSPVSDALYPRMSALVQSAPRLAKRIAVTTLSILVAAGVLVSAAVATAAGELVNLILGPGFSSSAEVLRVLALLLPIVAAGTVVGVQWLLPMGLEGRLLRIMGASAIINLTLAIVLAPRMGALGMAWAVVAAETTTLVGALIVAAGKDAVPRAVAVNHSGKEDSGGG